MKTRIRKVLGGLALLAACDGGASLAPLDTTALDQVLADSATAAGLIGVQAAVLVPDRQPWSGAWGHDDTTTTMRGDVLLSVADVTTNLIGALFVQMAADGAINLDAPISTWIPPTTNVPGTITVRQLLQQRSGLYGYTLNPAFINETQNRNRNRVWTPTELLGFVGTPVFSPGAAWQASGTNAVLLGMIAEAVVAQPLAAQVQSRLLGPAGLSSSWFPDAAGSGPAGAIGHTWTGGGIDFTANVMGPSVHTSRWAARGLLSTAGDLARWMHALMAGGVVTGSARSLMLTIGPDNGAFPGQVGAGLGIRKYAFLGRTQYGHGGTTENGNALVVWDEASGITVAVVLNQGGSALAAVPARIVPALLEAALTQVP